MRRSSILSAGLVLSAVLAAVSAADPIGPILPVATQGRVAARLAAGVSVSATRVSSGQKFTLTVTVLNTGDAVAAKVSAAGSEGTGHIFGAREFVARGLEPGGFLRFTWTLTARDPGRRKVSVTVTATGVPGSPFVAESPEIAVQSPARLHASLSVEPRELCAGQEVCVVLTLTNTGEAAADLDVAALALSGDGAATILEEAGPPRPVRLEGGGVLSWMWTLQATGPGTIGIAGEVRGRDANSHLSVISKARTTKPVVIHQHGALTASLATRGLVSVGQWASLRVTFANPGGSAVREISHRIRVTAGSATLVQGPFPAGDLALGPGVSRSILWTYSVAGAGPLEFECSADGQTCGAFTLSVAGRAALTAQTPAALAASFKTSAARVVAGQKFSVSLSVTDAGEAQARGVRPELMLCQGRVARITPHPRGFRDLESGKGTSYTWEYSTGAAGEATCSVRARGIDSNSGAPVMSAWLKVPVRILEPAKLVFRSFRILPADRAEQHTIVRAFVVVENEGEAAAEVLKIDTKEYVPKEYLKKMKKRWLAPGLVKWFGPSDKLPVTVPGGESVIIMWAYRAAQTVPTYVTIEAEGKEELTGRKVKIPLERSNEVEVVPPPKEEDEEEK